MKKSLTSPAAQIRAVLILAVIASASLHVVPHAHASTAVVITVNTAIDELNVDGDCSLREAISAANTDAAVDACPAGNGVDTITLPAGTFTLGIAGAGENLNATGDLDIKAALTLQGDVTSRTEINAAHLDRAFDIDAVPVTLRNLTVRNGQPGALDNGGGIRSAGALTLKDIDVSDSRSDGDGGGLAVLDVLTAEGGKFENNLCAGLTCAGGGIAAAGSAVITGTHFVSNTARNGGGISAVGVLAVSAATLVNNTAGQRGGAVHGTKISVQFTRIAGNRAQNVGGGVWAGVSVQLNDTQVISNSAVNNGGGVYSVGSAAMTQAQFEGNSAVLGGGFFGIGPVSIIANTFARNSAVNGGGGVYLTGAGAGVISATTFTSNNGNGGPGGGLYTNGVVAIYRSAFENNSGPQGAGAYFGAQSELVDCRFVNNTATGGGGGIYANGATGITRTAFINNSGQHGGALYHNNGSGRVVNSLFARNAATAGTGDAIYFASPNALHIAHATIARPVRGGGSAVRVGVGTVTLQNSIIAGHGTGVVVQSGALNENYNLYYDNGATVIGTTLGANSLLANPRFVNAAADDFHLGSFSVAVNAGQNSAITDDFDGDARPLYVTSDMGYDEFVEQPVSGLTADNTGPTRLGSVTTLNGAVSSGTNIFYTWSFGDGSPTTVLTTTQVAHSYPAVGAYTAIVTAANQLGELSTSTVVTIVDVPISGLSANTGAPVRQDNASSLNAGLTTGTNVSYVWNFGDGSLPAAGAAVTHVYPAVGVYTATVTATNSVDVRSATVQVSVLDRLIAGLTASNGGVRPLGSASAFSATIADGTNVSYVWNFGDRSPVVGGDFAQHTYGAIGTYTATVTATNPAGSVSAQTVLRVIDSQIAGLGVTGNITTEARYALALSAAVTAGSNVTYTWNFGDGTPLRIGNPMAHVFAQPGRYTVTVTATNSVSTQSTTHRLQAIVITRKQYLPLAGKR